MVRGVSSTLFIALAVFVVFAIDFAGSHPSLRMSVFLITAVVSIFGWYISGRLFQEFATRRWTSGTGTMLGETTQRFPILAFWKLVCAIALSVRGRL